MEKKPEKKCVGMSHKRRSKQVLGNVIGETFEFFNERTFEICTLKTVSDPNNSKHSLCPKNCFFRNLQHESAEIDKKAKSSGCTYWARNENHRNKVWPCYLVACSGYDRKTSWNGTNFGNCQLHYELIAKESIAQEAPGVTSITSP